MKKLLNSIILLLLLATASYGQSISFDIWNDVYAYGKASGLSDKDIRSIKEKNNPMICMIISSDHSLLDSLGNTIHLYFDEETRIELKGFAFKNVKPSVNDFEFMFCGRQGEHLNEKLKTQPIVKVDMMRYKGFGRYDTICETKLKDPYEFVKFFENE